MKNILIAACIAIVIIIIVFIVRHSGKIYTIELTQTEIQRELDKRFPIEKGILILSVKLSNPVVNLKEGSDRIQFAINAGTNIQVNGITPSGTGTVTTKIEYSSEQGEFYLADPDLFLKIDNIKEKTNKKINEISNILLAEYVNKYPIYKLKNTDIKENIAILILRDVKVANGVLKIQLGIRV